MRYVSGRDLHWTCKLQAFRGLYPYPVHHPYDQYSMVDFDRPDAAAWPHFLSGARGRCCILTPGDLLFVPQYWCAATTTHSASVPRYISFEAVPQRCVYMREQARVRPSICDESADPP